MVDGEEGLATGKEMTDNDVSELLNDERQPAEGEEPELLSEPEDGEDLPEGLPEEGEVQDPEPEGKSELDRLKDMGYYRAGMIESFEDLGKSYGNIEKRFSERPVVEREIPSQPEANPQDIVNELNEALAGENPAGAVVQIFNAMSSGTNQELGELRSRQFVNDNPGAKELTEDMSNIQQKYPGMSSQDAYNMARGSKMDSIVDGAKDKATQTERLRETDKKQALRERPGGVRAAPASAQQALENARKGLTGQAAVEAMETALDKQGLGLTEE